MSTNHETLNIGSLRRRRDPGDAPAQPRVDPENHPDAARAARDKIASMNHGNPLTDPLRVPAHPTADLITNREQLARHPDTMPQATKRRIIPSILKPMLTAMGIFALILLLFKAPVVFSQLKYSMSPRTPAPSAAPAVADTVPAANTISIPKINVTAPVIYQSSVSEADIQRALQDGVIHYGTTPAPGEGGNVAIFGHSSNDWWEPGNYKFVFVLLDKLAPGDQITMDYQSTRYVYEVTGSRVVEPTDVGVLAQTSSPTLSLITCTPPGTSLRRLVVTAKQVSPDPKGAKVAAKPAATPAPSGSSLPSSAPGFFDQISQAWNGIAHSFKSLFGGDSTSPAPSPSPTSGQLPAVK